ncbi:unnamed protein product [Blepharisma stoltei]|uniref:FYVE-type domain-containing protein n=1 Tax=Blepharisma stoltei TaxID=1481888 RepID=A0AAU9K5J7_9CILI|nr:unnamed protein product [Blepharisma stoltei]
MDSSFTGSFASEVVDEDLPIELPSDREQWKIDTQCTVCQMSLNIPGISHSQKNCCMFCYRGICAKCISKQALHPETSKLEKMCIICSQKIIITDFNSEYRKFRQEIAELKIRINKEIDNRECLSKERKTLEEEIENNQSDYDFQLDLLLQKRNKATSTKEDLKIKKKELEIRLKDAREKQKTDLKVIEELENQKDKEKQNYENNRNKLFEMKKKSEELVALKLKLLRKTEQFSGNSFSNYEEKSKIQEVIEELAKQKRNAAEENDMLVIDLNRTINSSMRKEKEIERLEKELNAKNEKPINPFENKNQDLLVTEAEEDQQKTKDENYDEGPQIILKMDPDNYLENVKKSFHQVQNKLLEDKSKNQIMAESPKCIRCDLF